MKDENDRYITEQELKILSNKAERLIYESVARFPIEQRDPGEPESEQLEDSESEIDELVRRFDLRQQAIKEFRNRSDLLQWINAWNSPAHYHPDDLVNLYTELTGVNKSYKTLSRMAKELHEKFKKLDYKTPQERHDASVAYQSAKRRASQGAGVGGTTRGSNVNMGSGKSVRSVQPDSFPGKVYRDKTRLSDDIIKKWKKTTLPKYLRGETTYLRHFIIGYEMKFGNLFYEIWYNNKSATFEVIDRHGYPLFDKMNSLREAVDRFIDMISDKEPAEREKIERDARKFYRDAHGSMSAAKRREKRAVFESFDTDEFDNLMESIESEIEPYFYEEDDAHRQQRLKESDSIRQILHQTVKDELLEEYHESKLSERQVKRLLFNLASGFLTDNERKNYNWYEKVKLTAKRGFRSFFRLTLGDVRADFIVGFKIGDNGVKTEIWEIYRKTGNRPSEFYVVDVTSKKVLRRNFKNLRQAINEIRDRFIIE